MHGVKISPASPSAQATPRLSMGAEAPTPIAKTQSAHYSDWDGMRLPSDPGQNCFTALCPKWTPDAPKESSKPLTSAEKNRIASRQRYRDKQIKLATSVNKNQHNPTTQADADKTAKLMGKSNGARLP